MPVGVAVPGGGCVASRFWSAPAAARFSRCSDRRGETLSPTRTAGGTTIDSSYNAAHLLVLEGLEAVRKRPGMYIGSTDTRGLMHCVWEIIDNGVDEALAGAAHHIEVTLHADGSVEVYDDGRGIPVDKEPKTGLPGVEVIFTKLHAGGKFGGGSYVATGGLHGVGASVVNALSSRLDVDVDRTPATQGMSFQRGAPGCLRRRRAGCRLHGEVGSDPQGRAGQEGRQRDAHPVLAGPADLHQGRHRRLRRARHPGPADVVHRARAGAGDPRPARGRAGRGEVPARRRDRRVLRLPRRRRAGDPDPPAARQRHLHRDRPRCSTPRAT